MLSAYDSTAALATQQQSSLASAANALAAKSNTQAQLEKSAEDFESVFATEMLTPIFDKVEVNETFGGGHGEEMFRTLIVDQYGKEMGRTDAFHLKSELTAAMLKLQEGKH